MRRVRVRVLSVDLSESGMTLFKVRAKVLMMMLNLYVLDRQAWRIMQLRHIGMTDLTFIRNGAKLHLCNPHFCPRSAQTATISIVLFDGRVCLQAICKVSVKLGAALYLLPRHACGRPKRGILLVHRGRFGMWRYMRTRQWSSV